MKKDSNITTVTFYRDLDPECTDPIFAVLGKPFINRAYNDMRVTIYQHIGQHNEARADYLKDKKLCTPCNDETQYNDLKKELEGLGYILRVKFKIGNGYARV